MSSAFLRIRGFAGWNLPTLSVYRTKLPSVSRTSDRLARHSRPSSTRGSQHHPYPYRSINEKYHIRLLSLQPTCRGDTITVSLQHSSLDRNPAYEAVSYTWDDPYAAKLLGSDSPTIAVRNQLRCIIICDGSHMHVSPNLYSALRRLRHFHDTRVLWIDALCINQADETEKAMQVQSMHEIYSKAKEVIVWLGEEDSWTASSKDVISRWADVYRSNPSLHQPELLQSLKKHNTFSSDQIRFEAWIRRAWFTRVWTFQELCLAHKATMYCGSHAVPWQDFGAACAAIIKAGQAAFVFEEQENIQTLHDFWRLWKTTPAADRREDERFQLSRLLQRTRMQQATDPRDKLYSLLAIANPPCVDSSAFSIDYTNSVQHIFTRFTREMIIEDGDLGILSAVRAPHSGEASDPGSRHHLLPEAEGHMHAVEAIGMVTDNQDHLEGDIISEQEGSSETRPYREGITEHLDPDYIPYLPSWVPDYAQDKPEYVADDELIHHGPPTNLTRTKHPRPIAQQYSDGWPRYWTNKQFSYSGNPRDITFETHNQSRLGVFGIKIGTIVRTYEMPFTADPSIRVPAHERGTGSPEASRKDDSLAALPSPPSPLNFNFLKKLLPVAGDLMASANDILTNGNYTHTKEPTALALLKTLTADMLPISSRLPESHKRVDFPFHYDWYFWNRRTLDLLTKAGQLSLAALLVMPPIMLMLMWYVPRQIIEVWKAKASVRLRGGSTQEDWTAFDERELKYPRRIREFYRQVIVGPEDQSIFEVCRVKNRGLSLFPSNTWLCLLTVPSLFIMYHMKQFIVPLIWLGVQFPFAAALLLLHTYGVVKSRRLARIVERSPSVPVGWDAMDGEVIAAAIALERENKELAAEHQSLWGMACEIQNAINRASWRRHFFITDNGYMGVGPIGMKPGDEVWSLLGGHVPFVLRNPTTAPENSTKDFVHLVGECYVHGIMEGQAWDDCRSMDDMKKKASKLIIV